MFVIIVMKIFDGVAMMCDGGLAVSRCSRIRGVNAVYGSVIRLSVIAIVLTALQQRPSTATQIQ